MQIPEATAMQPFQGITVPSCWSDTSYCFSAQPGRKQDSVDISFKILSLLMSKLIPCQSNQNSSVAVHTTDESQVLVIAVLVILRIKGDLRKALLPRKGKEGVWLLKKGNKMLRLVYSS